jgi:chromosome segregation ATPase
VKYLQNKLQDQMNSYEEIIIQNDEKFEEISKKYEISRKAENELRSLLLFQKEDIAGLHEGVKKLTADLKEKNEQCSIYHRQNIAKNTEINQLQEAINDLNNQLRDKEKLKADLLKLKSLNNKLTTYNDDLEKENEAQNNAVDFLSKEKNSMVNMVRALIYKHTDYVEASLVLSENDVNENHKKQKNQCPIVGCTGAGHINGKSKRHSV